ncbi:stage III sporulation protein AE [Thermincola potens JR]|uniref:Stage III sporulation protein AE n=1 Tax=Thermincola potens (strain JR) TaxID=635013 RepID=D5X7K3_THEPJ|nr:stage III sporulation protein AE [Thermincola potens JR]
MGDVVAGRYKKGWAVIILLALALFSGFLTGRAYAVEPAEEDIRSANAGKVEQELDALDLREMEKYLDEINREIADYVPQLELRSLIGKIARGEFEFGFTDILTGLLKFLFHEIIANSKLLGELLVLTVICAVLQNIESAFEQGTVGKVAWTVCYLTLFILALKSFGIALGIGREAISDMVSFMQATLPVLITLLTAMGNLTSAALFHPLTVTVLSSISTLIKNIVFPLIFFSAVLGLTSNISERFQVSKMSGLMKQWSMALMGLFFTVFLGFLSVQGIAGSVADGVALRTAKFATGAFVPVLGKMFADALDAVVGTSLLLKNVVGLVGIIAIFFICIFPALKILSIMLIFRVAAAISQPISDTKLVESLNTMGNSLGLVFAAVSSVGIMFFFVIAIVLGTGNVSLMMR